MPLPGFWRFARHFLNFQALHPLPVCGWCPSCCCPGAGSQSGWVLRLCSLTKQSLLKIWQFLLLPQPPLDFTARSYRDLSSQCWTPGLCGLPGAGITHFQDSFSNFYPPHLNVGPPMLVPPLLPPLLATPCLSTLLRVSASPIHLDECGFFKSLVAGLPYSLIF